MPWNVLYDPAVLDDVRGIPANLQGRIRRAIETRLRVAPDQYGERLSKDLHGLWKLRVGDYRIVFEIDPKAHVVTVLGIRQRKEINSTPLRRRFGRR